MQKTERTTVMADLLQKADYSTPAKKKRLVESERQRMLKAANTVNADTESYLGGTFGDRRQKAILSYLDRAEKEFCAFGLTSVVEQFVKSELIPFNNYNHLDEDNDLRIGAALWILDKLRENGTLRDAFGILPDISGNVDAWYLPIDFSHPCYDVQLIQSFIHLISKRYSDGRNVVITEQNAVGRKPCEAYEQLLELLPEKSIETVCEAFRAKQWELVTRFMKGQAYYDRELERSVREIQQSQSMITAPFAKPGVSSGFGSVGGGFGSIGSFDTIGGSSNKNAVDIALRGQELIEQSNDYL